ncbi:hypothetical protein Taro_026552 [Colocasia esculenta]|uniref:Ubiquitin-like protease family profile domain-containing protein n=1 Tax=Colocasia esculenta TaxID=4460 RepID=A0A843VBQ1_COLES|nr:hypothetical protein [Colocasia esculenta]
MTGGGRWRRQGMLLDMRGEVAPTGGLHHTLLGIIGNFFLKIAYEGKEMRAVADELKVVDLHVPKVPQQKGNTECGFMVLCFIFCFILTAPASFGTDDYPSFLTVNWCSREEYEKFREDLQGKIIYIDALSASTSKMDKIQDIKLTQQSSTSSSIARVGDTYEQVLGRDKTGRIRGIGMGPTPKSLWGSRSEQKLH